MSRLFKECSSEELSIISLNAQALGCCFDGPRVFPCFPFLFHCLCCFLDSVCLLSGQANGRYCPLHTQVHQNGILGSAFPPIPPSTLSAVSQRGCYPSTPPRGLFVFLWVAFWFPSLLFDQRRRLCDREYRAVHVHGMYRMTTCSQLRRFHLSNLSLTSKPMS